MKQLNILVTTTFLCLACALQADERLPEPYRSIELLPLEDHGWYFNAKQMEQLFEEKGDIQIVVEVGSWLGQSTCHIAQLVPEGGKVYAVDHWLGSEEHQPGHYAWHPSMPRLYQQFLSNIIHKQLTDKIIPVRMHSLEAAKALDVTPDLVYIDAGHDTASVYKDLKAWYPKVRGHGVLCGDDWGWKSVQQAVNKFAQKRKLTVVAEGNFWQLQE